MADKLTLQIHATFSAIEPANETASQWLTERNAPPQVQYLATLAVEELVTNSIKYGYEDAGDHIIEIKLEIPGNELVLTVTDDGIPFNPLDLPAPDTDLPLEERPIGGLGIHLLRRMSDRMEYSPRCRKKQCHSPQVHDYAASHLSRMKTPAQPREIDHRDSLARAVVRSCPPFPSH